MKKYILPISTVLSFALVLLTSVEQLSFAAFKENIWSARSSAMGGAFISISNEAASISFNPAGISQLEMKEANFSYVQKFMGLPNVTVGNMSAFFAYPYIEKIGAFGVGYISSDVSSLYSEQTIALNYSVPLHKMLGTRIVKVGKKQREFPRLSLPIYAGINLKMLSIKYNISQDPNTSIDPVFKNGDSAGGLAADIGFLVKPIDIVSAALVVKNFVSPNIAIGKDSTGSSATEPVPMEIGIGGAFRAGDKGAFEDITVAIDLINRTPKDASSEFNWRLGLESWFGYHRYAGRVGFNNTDFSLGGGLIRNFGTVELQIDYAFTLPIAVSDNSGHHRISVATRF